PTTTTQQRKEWYSKEEFENEVWKPVIGSNEKFLISSYGRFQRVYKDGPKFLLPFMNGKGYMEIKVMYRGLYKSYKISNLVGTHFIGAPKENEVLRHKNGIKTDDYVGNLEYKDRIQVSKYTGPLSRSKPVVKLDPETKEIIGEYR
ncbi:NUMOD4 domain-containing protein, partial [Micrococcus sp. SIMBA_144]